jgi:hypothetical protein
LELDDSDAELLPGEDPQKAAPEDAEHWVRVYAELLETVDGILGNEAPGDRAALEQRRSKYLHRLEWWRARLKA